VSQYFRLAALPFLLIALTQTASAGNTATFTDPTGDATGIPDIVSLTATSQDPSTVTVRVSFAGPAAFGNGVGFALVLDADDSRATGHNGDGVDDWFVLSRTDASFRAERWDGSAFVPYGSRATAVVAGNSVTVRFGVRQLTPRGPVFRFEASTYDDTHQDEAPGGPDYFRFETRFAKKPSFSPARPVAGKRFTVLDPRSATCRASIRGRAVRPIRRCAWRIPKTASGKRLTVSVGARRYTFLVRRP
jgi:hypothetical protein